MTACTCCQVFGATPIALAALGLPCLGEVGIGEHVGADVHRVAIAVDRDAMDFAVPGADRRLEVIDDVVEIDLLHHPVGHFRQQVLDAHVAFERRAHFDDVEVDGAGGDRLLQARVVVGLGEVDPFDLGARIGLPRRQEAAEQEVMQVLVVEAHEGEFDALEFAGLNVGLGCVEAEFADFLPIGVGRRSIAGPWNFHDLGDDAVGGISRRAERPKAPPAASAAAAPAAPFNIWRRLACIAINCS